MIDGLFEVLKCVLELLEVSYCWLMDELGQLVNRKREVWASQGDIF